MSVDAEGVRPLEFTAADPDDGKLQAQVLFDWSALRATGVVEGTAIDMALHPGVQDDLSIQVAMMQALANGQIPAGISLFDKNGIRDYEYTRVGAEILQTPVGPLQTVIYRSHKANSPRSNRYWCAPELGFVPVQAEQQYKGKVELVIKLQSITASSRGQRPSGLGQCHALLAHVLTAAIAIGSRAHLVGFEEQHLRHAFVGVDLGRQRRGVGELQRHVPFPLGLQRRDVDDDAAARVGRFAQAHREYVARNAEIFHRPCQREGVRRNDAHLSGDVDETLGVEMLGIDDGGIDIGEDLELRAQRTS